MRTAIQSTEFIQGIDTIIKKNLSNKNLNGAFIAQQLGLSRMHLHRKLKLHCNKNTSQFIKMKRIEYAKKILRKSNDSIQIVAIKSGFSNLPYFCKIFKEIEGITPSQYRKSYGLTKN